MPSKKELLEELAEKMEKDASLPLTGQANLVFGEGNPNAEVLFIGEAPGFHEDRLKRPFVGLAGQLLDKLLLEINWPRESVYITNIVKRRPPQNRDPLPEEITAYTPYLEKQIELLAPKLIAPLGRFSMNFFLPEAKISRDHGKLMKTERWPIFPLYHPAAALRSTGVLEELKADFKRLPEILELIKTGKTASVEELDTPPEPPQQTLF